MIVINNTHVTKSPAAYSGQIWKHKVTKEHFILLGGDVPTDPLEPDYRRLYSLQTLEVWGSEELWRDSEDEFEFVSDRVTLTFE